MLRSCTSSGQEDLKRNQRLSPKLSRWRLMITPERTCNHEATGGCCHVVIGACNHVLTGGSGLIPGHVGVRERRLHINTQQRHRRSSSSFHLQSLPLTAFITMPSPSTIGLEKRLREHAARIDAALEHLPADPPTRAKFAVQLCSEAVRLMLFYRNDTYLVSSECALLGEQKPSDLPDPHSGMESLEAWIGPYEGRGGKLGEGAVDDGDSPAYGWRTAEEGRPILGGPCGGGGESVVEGLRRW